MDKIKKEDTDKRYKFTDESGDKEYFTIIPNMTVNGFNVYESGIYLLIKRIAGEDGACWMSEKRMCGTLGIDPQTLRKHRDSLEKKGVIKFVGWHKGKTHPVREYKIVNIWWENAEYYRQQKKEGNKHPFSKKEGLDLKKEGNNHSLKEGNNHHKEEPLKEDLKEEERDKYLNPPKRTTTELKKNKEAISRTRKELKGNGVLPK